MSKVNLTTEIKNNSEQSIKSEPITTECYEKNRVNANSNSNKIINNKSRNYNDMNKKIKWLEKQYELEQNKYKIIKIEQESSTRINQFIMTENNTLKNSLDENRIVIKELRQENAKLKDEINQTRTTNKLLEQENKKISDENKDLLKRRSNEISVTEKQINNKNIELNKLNNLVNEKQQVNENLNNEINEIRSANKILQQANERLSDDNRNQLKQHNAEMLKTQKQINKKDLELNQLDDLLTEKESELNEANSLINRIKSNVFSNDWKRITSINNTNNKRCLNNYH